MTQKIRILIYTVLLIGLLVSWSNGSLEQGFDTAVKRRALFLAQEKIKSYEGNFLGVRVQQFPNDLMSYAELLYDLKPDFVIETGTFYGGGTLFLASVLQHINPEGKVLTVDIDPQPWQETRARGLIPPELDDRIVFFEGSSTAPEVIAQIREQIPERSKVLVILDSYHKREHVFNELMLYREFVLPGSYVLVNDTQHDRLFVGRAGHGPLAAVEEFLQKDSHFERDTGRERFFISALNSGFLKRVH